MILKNLAKIPSDEILEGSFGIEWESLRAKDDGKLSLTPHPAVFGDKLTNPLVTTDFSESQIEIITPTFDTIDDAFENFSCDKLGSISYLESVKFNFNPSYDGIFPIETYNQVIGYEVAWYYA